MPVKKQTRCAINIRGIVYERLRRHCEATGQAMSAFLEEVIAENLDAQGVPIATTAKAKTPKPPPPVNGGGIVQF
jgi:hypothetical protein